MGNFGVALRDLERVSVFCFVRSEGCPHALALARRTANAATSLSETTCRVVIAPLGLTDAWRRWLMGSR